MAKKFKIAQDATFKQDVEIPRVGGDPITVNFEFKYLTRKDLAALYDRWRAAALALGVDENSTLTELTDAEVDLQVEQIKDIVVGWGFEDEFNDENIAAVVETSVSAATAIIDKYQESYAKARSGN